MTNDDAWRQQILEGMISTWIEQRYSKGMMPEGAMSTALDYALPLIRERDAQIAEQEPAQGLVAPLIRESIAAAIRQGNPPSTDAARSCTCHPSDNPPKPCQQKYAYSECVKAAEAATLRAVLDQAEEALVPFAQGIVDQYDWDRARLALSAIRAAKEPPHAE